jgi:hypothetical protein
MKINFDDLRKKLIKDYNQLIKTLNGAICSDCDMDRVVAPVHEISLYLERLRVDVITIGCLNDPSIEDCNCVVDDETEIKEFLVNR